MARSEFYVPGTFFVDVLENKGDGKVHYEELVDSRTAEKARAVERALREAAPRLKADAPFRVSVWEVHDCDLFGVPDCSSDFWIEYRSGQLDRRYMSQVRRQVIEARLIADAAPALSQTEADVLQAVLSYHGRPALVDELAGVSGYSHSAVVRAVRRLLGLGLVKRPEGSRRKGVVPTAAGASAARTVST